MAGRRRHSAILLTPTTWRTTNAVAAGFAGITANSGQGGLNMNVYYTLIENSQLPQITVGNPAALPATTTVSISSSGACDLNGSPQTVAGLSDLTAGSGGSVINSSNVLGAPTLTLAPVGGATSTFSGTIGGGPAMNVVMNGNGTQVLNGCAAGHGQPDGPAGPAGLRRREPDGRRHDPQ